MTGQRWSAETIARLAFCQPLAAENSPLADQIVQLEQLCQTICNHFCGHSQAEKAIVAIQQGQEKELMRLVVYLQDAMEAHPDFATKVQILAQSIQTVQLQPEPRMEQTVQNEGKGVQTRVEGGKAYISDDLYITENSSMSHYNAGSSVGSQTATVQGNQINYNFFGKSHPLEKSPHSQSNGSKPPTPHNIPRSDVVFVDRKPEVEQLHQLLQQHNLVVITNKVNLDGLGKTELTIQYCRKHKADYPGGICWLYPSRSDVGIQLVEFVRGWFTQAKIPTTLSLDNQISRCWQHWQEGQALLVVDHVTDYEQIKSYLPSDDRFKVLIIAPSSARLPMQRSQYLPLAGLPPDAALELLTALLGEEQVQQEIAFAEKLCDFVGYSPLGLHTVARYRKPEVSYAS